MRDLITRQYAGSKQSPTGLAFDISDLILIGCWAAIYDFEAQVLLDHGFEDEEYEEIVEFRTGPGSACQSIMWRDAMAVYLQPIMGRKTKYLSVAAALEGVLVSQDRRFRESRTGSRPVIQKHAR